MTVIDLSWERYGLIAELAFRLKDKRVQFGKTALQKIVYLLQVLYNVKCGYDFSLYAYGPFSKELLSDLDLVEMLGGVEVKDVISGAGGYHIEPGKRNDWIREKAKDFLDTHDLVFDKVIDEFGSLGARELELRATIVYADRSLQRAGQNPSRQEFISLIKELKPLFGIEAIEEALGDLEKKGYVAVRH